MWYVLTRQIVRYFAVINKLEATPHRKDGQGRTQLGLCFDNKNIFLDVAKGRIHVGFGLIIMHCLIRHKIPTN